MHATKKRGSIILPLPCCFYTAQKLSNRFHYMAAGYVVSSYMCSSNPKNSSMLWAQIVDKNFRKLNVRNCHT